MLIVLSIAVLVVALILAGVVYQLLGSRHDRRIHTGEGRSVTIANRSNLYLFELGFGEPTVLFEAGIGATHLNWRSIQEAIAQFTGTVSYDRGGLGWSSRCRSARTPFNIAQELHQMLRPRRIQAALHSGRTFLRRTRDAPLRAALSPTSRRRCAHRSHALRRMAAARPHEAIPARSGPQADPLRDAGCALRAGAPLCFAAVLPGRKSLRPDCRRRRSQQPPRAGPDQDRSEQNAARRSGRRSPRIGRGPDSMPECAAISHPFPSTVTEMHAAEPIHSIPVTVLTPGNAAPLSQRHLERIGDHVQQVIASKSEHWIHLDEPDLVIDSIRAMVSAQVAETLVTAD